MGRRVPTLDEQEISYWRHDHPADRRGKVEALTGLDLVAESGQVVALLGPNGAGKTTFVRSVATLVRPDSGSLRVAGIIAVFALIAIARFRTR